jgi:hypothetical protein
MYKLKNLDGQLVCIEKIEEGYSHLIPIAPDNTDYQAYLKWVADGNTPLPAENA